MSSDSDNSPDENNKNGSKSAHKIHFFEKEILVEDCKDLSQQAVVFFGRERKFGFKVVLKQYRGKAN